VKSNFRRIWGSANFFQIQSSHFGLKSRSERSQSLNSEAFHGNKCSRDFFPNLNPFCTGFGGNSANFFQMQSSRFGLKGRSERSRSLNSEAFHRNKCARDFFPNLNPLCWGFEGGTGISGLPVWSRTARKCFLNHPQ
jgi:hypothetical protein